MAENNNNDGGVLTLIDSINRRLDLLYSVNVNGKENGNGKQVIDPTLNVKELVESSIEHINELLSSQKDRIDGILFAEKDRINELLKITDEHNKELREAESKRLNAIHEVDVVGMASVNDRVNQQSVILSTQITAAAENLKLQMNGISERLYTIEKSQSEHKGSAAGSREIIAYIIAIVTFIAAVAGFLIHH
jgi:hypothetical protein